MDKLKGEFGLNQTLSWLQLSKSSWYYHLNSQTQPTQQQTRREYLAKELLPIVRKHADYGYRRIVAELKDKLKQAVNHKLVVKLLRAQELLTVRTATKPKDSPIRQILLKLGDLMNRYAPKLLAEATGTIVIGVFKIFTTDYTEIIYDQGRRKQQLIPIIDHKSKYCAGWALGPRATSELAITALNQTASTLKTWGYTLDGAMIHHDRGTQFQSYVWLVQVLIGYVMELSYALRGAKDNPAQESFNGRFKKENRDLFWECRTDQELLRVVGERIKYYNERRRHSSIGNIPPLEYLKRHGNAAN